MRIYDIIKRKRDGEELTEEEISFFTQSVTNGFASDEQTGAFLMAVYFNGMTRAETLALTNAMAKSGDSLDLSGWGRACADKHSSGGVGDKTTLAVAPLAACCGVTVAKMSGRGLGFTGGTVDKLEAIPGFKTELDEEEFASIAKKTGIAVVAQTKNLAPCDKKLYAARDLTATVDSVPLIVSSIMSKKLAAGAPNIVLDVKTGSGAFAKTRRFAETLAREMTLVARLAGRRATAFVTDIDEPLGYCVGNALEVAEAAEVLRGRGEPRLTELCLALASEMTRLALGISAKEAEERVREALETGGALRKFKEWVAAQGGDTAFLNAPERICNAPFSMDVKLKGGGFVVGINAEKIGETCLALGAGRNKKEDGIDLSAGIVLRKKKGDFAAEGETCVTLYCSDEKLFEKAVGLAADAFALGDEKPESSPIIIEKIE